MSLFSNNFSLKSKQNVAIVVAMLMLSALAWVITIKPELIFASQLYTGGITDLLVFVFIWTIMMAAMMLPSLIPMVLLYIPASQSRKEIGFKAAPSSIFVSGYLTSWAMIGLGLYFIKQTGFTLSGNGNPIFIGSALMLSGFYQLTRWKELCLGHCRTPLHFLMNEWKDGYGGAFQMGIQHGLYCVGCCWSLMLAQVVLGMMNLGWMGLVATIIFIEKIFPKGDQIAKYAGAGLMLSGLGLIIVGT